VPEREKAMGKENKAGINEEEKVSNWGRKGAGSRKKKTII